MSRRVWNILFLFRCCFVSFVVFFCFSYAYIHSSFTSAFVTKNAQACGCECVCGHFGKKNDDECLTSHWRDHTEQKCEWDERKKNTRMCFKLLKINNAPRSQNASFGKCAQHVKCNRQIKNLPILRAFVWILMEFQLFDHFTQTHYHFSWRKCHIWHQMGVWSIERLKEFGPTKPKPTQSLGHSIRFNISMTIYSCEFVIAYSVSGWSVCYCLFILSVSRLRSF